MVNDPLLPDEFDDDELEDEEDEEAIEARRLAALEAEGFDDPELDDL